VFCALAPPVEETKIPRIAMVRTMDRLNMAILHRLRVGDRTHIAKFCLVPIPG
jgi:hypothetical protein